MIVQLLSNRFTVRPFTTAGGFESSDASWIPSAFVSNQIVSQILHSESKYVVGSSLGSVTLFVCVFNGFVVSSISGFGVSGGRVSSFVFGSVSVSDTSDTIVPPGLLAVDGLVPETLAVFSIQPALTSV